MYYLKIKKLEIKNLINIYYIITIPKISQQATPTYRLSSSYQYGYACQI